MLTGQYPWSFVKRTFRNNTILLAAMYANNETGLIHPVRELAALAREHGVLFFLPDGVQAVG